jgi:hypothetical protein
MKLLVAIATIGALLRVRNYQFARSMWLDEIALAVSLRDIGFPEILTSPLLNRQSASPGYLVASKAAVRIFGTDEYGLRLVALISGIATLVLAVLDRSTTAQASMGTSGIRLNDRVLSGAHLLLQ